MAKSTTRARPRKPTTKTKTRTARKKAATRSAAVRRRRERKLPPKPSKLSTAATTLRGAVAGVIATVSNQVAGDAAKPDAIEILEREVVLEGFEEHHVADLILKELHEVATNDEGWGAKFKVLKESVEHHIQEEEQTMFRLARGIFSRQELRVLASRMLKIRHAT